MAKKRRPPRRKAVYCIEPNDLGGSQAVLLGTDKRTIRGLVGADGWDAETTRAYMRRHYPDAREVVARSSRSSR